MAKDKEYRRLIHKHRWVKLRRSKLTANPLCEDCFAQGIVTPATEVHHIKPVEDALTAADKEALMFDPHNLRSLCHACHLAAHVALGRGGKVHARRRAAEKLKSFSEKFFGNEREGGLFF
jgi:5-methylcytosine-specific restriction protein A